MNLIIDHHIIFGNKPHSNFLPKEHMADALNLFTIYLQNTTDTLCILCPKNLVDTVKESTFMLGFKNNANVTVAPFQQGGLLPTLKPYLPKAANKKLKKDIHFITPDYIAQSEAHNTLGIQTHYIYGNGQDIYPQLENLFTQKLWQTAQPS